MPIKTIIMGAAGRDFHNFNTFFRGNKDYEVVAFTATQIPDIEGRLYPPELAGELYPSGIPIRAEEELVDLIKQYNVEQVIFAYSDVPHEYVMHKAAAIRHPMPYGNLVRQEVQRFSDYDDLDEHETTIEEREEFEPHLDNGVIVYAGVDYEKILRQAEQEVDIVLWDGGNNDFPFYKSDLQIVVADPHRPGHESSYHPGETNARLADVFVINKVDTADPENVIKVRESLRSLNPTAIIIEGASPLFVNDPEAIRGKRVLVVEDGPTLTHGEMAYGAGYVAARRFGAKEIVDPRPFAVKSIAATYQKYPKTGPILPAMGYGDAQMKDLEETINKSNADMVVVGTPIDLTRVIKLRKPYQRVRYELQEIGQPTLRDILTQKFGAKK